LSHFVPAFPIAIAPRLAAAGASTLACLVTEYSPNNFPALPVREGEHVFAWFAGYQDRAAYDGCRHARVEVLRAAAHCPRLAAAPQVLRLDPTRRSHLTGSAPLATNGRKPPWKEKQ
jgi:hypothetical protein